jgi:hypothetical protein
MYPLPPITIVVGRRSLQKGVCEVFRWKKYDNLKTSHTVEKILWHAADHPKQTGLYVFTGWEKTAGYLSVHILC